MRQGPKPSPLRQEAPSDGMGLPRLMFYVLAESPCPYLPGRRERKLITEINSGHPQLHYSLLSRGGFRRSHQFAYRPACSGCTACVPVRIRAEEFALSRSQKRIWRQNAGLFVSERPAQATLEQYALFSRYIQSRHGNGEMAGMSFADYRSMVEHSRVKTRVLEFRDASRRLVAACLIDWLEDGPSAVYSFFTPELNRRSLGTFMILMLVAKARARGLAYVYLGYWIESAAKMDYKRRFHPLEALGAEGWRVLGSGG